MNNLLYCLIYFVCSTGMPKQEILNIIGFYGLLHVWLLLKLCGSYLKIIYWISEKQAWTLYVINMAFFHFLG